MHTSPRALSRVALGTLLFCACGSDSAPRGLDAGPDDAPAPPGVEAGSEALPGPVASADGATADAVVVGPDAAERKCGNGQVDPGEQCDDGNALSGDGCSSRCQIEGWPPCPGGCVPVAICGNGVLSSAEICDDGNVQGGDGCSADCRTIEPGWSCRAPGLGCAPICGDHVLKGSETCDDGNILDGDGCSIYCLTEPGWDCSSGTCVQVSPLDGGVDSGATALFCGDGIISGAEECDRGASNDDSEYGGCTTRCFFGPYCGDSIRNGPEEACDLGAQNGKVDGKDGCTVGCQKPHYCGDGNVDTDRGEECDLGDRNGLALGGDMMPTGDSGGIVYCAVDCRIAGWVLDP